MFAEPLALSSSSGINVSKSRVGDTFLLLLLLLFQDDALVILYNIYGGATIQQDAIAPYKGTSLAKKRLAQWPTRSSPPLFIATNFPFPAHTHMLYYFSSFFLGQHPHPAVFHFQPLSHFLLSPGFISPLFCLFFFLSLRTPSVQALWALINGVVVERMVMARKERKNTAVR